MIDRGWIRAILLGGPPAVILVLTAMAWQHGAITSKPMVVAIIAIALYAAGMAVFCNRAIAANEALAEDIKAVEARTVQLQANNLELRREIELLAAMREVTRVVTMDVDFEAILSDVLAIVDGLFETTSITIYLEDTSTQDLDPKAQRHTDATHFGNKILTDELDKDAAQEAFKTHMIGRSAASDVLHLLVPLLADRECLGVLELTKALEGSHDAKVSLADRLESQARDMAEHIAVAIKTSHLHDKAIIDGLTKLYTKRHFLEQLDAQLNLAKRHNKAFSLIIADIDHFKNVNDTYGHLTGDIVLIGVSHTLKRLIRRSDMAFRYGGEELALILPETLTPGAQQLAERARKKIEARTYKAEDGRTLKVTASFGVATWREGLDSPQAIVEAADKALYEAKEGGRNRVCLAAG